MPFKPYIDCDRFDRHECCYYHVVASQSYSLRFANKHDALLVFAQLYRLDCEQQLQQLDAILAPFKFHNTLYWRKS